MVSPSPSLPARHASLVLFSRVPRSWNRALPRFLVASLFQGKVHGSLARAGKVKGQTPKVEKQDKKRKPRGNFTETARTPSSPQLPTYTCL